MSDLRLIVGLGNPGRDYEYTRHNLGFLVLEQIVEERKLKLTSSSVCRGAFAEDEISGVEYCLLLPLTHMNRSGVAIKQFVEQKQISFENILIVCDDFNLDFGQLRLRRRGSDGGHNGLASAIEKLETQDFARLRLGIGAPKNKSDIINFVLEKFSPNEVKQLEGIKQEGASCCLSWLTEEFEKVTSQFNRRVENG